MKTILTIIAVVITLIMWAMLIWVVTDFLKFCYGINYGLIVAAIIFVLVLLAFPAILIVPIYKASSGFTLGAIWCIAISVYSIIPLRFYIDKHMYDVRYNITNELNEKLWNPSTSWEELKVIVVKTVDVTDKTMNDIMSDIINKRRFDLAQKMATEMLDMKTFNMATFLCRSEVDTISRVDMIEFMLNCGTDINSYSSNGDNSLNISLINKDTLSAKFLIDRGIDYSPLSGSHSVIALAACAGSWKMVEFFLDKGMDINHQGLYNMTPLSYVACYGDNAEIVELLCQNGAAIGSVNLNGKTPLCDAVSNDNIKIVEVLLKYGADVNFVNENGRTPILRVSMYYDDAMATMSLLVKNGANVNHIDNEGYDAIYHAKYNEDVIRILVEAGAIANRIYPDGRAILDFVDKEESHDLWQYLYARGARTTQE